MHEIYDCRRALEGLAARRLAADADGRQPAVERLRGLVAEMQVVSTGHDPLARADVDHRFHVALCELTGNEWLIRLYAQIADQSRLMQTLDSTAHLQPDGYELVAMHQPIVDALESRDEGAAEKAVVAHIDLSERLFVSEVPAVADAG